MDKPFNNSSRIMLQRLFLHCVFSNPIFLKGEIAKNMDLPMEDVELKHEKTDESYSIYTLLLCGSAFTLRFDKKIEEPREIDVPKVVYAPKKWYQSHPQRTVVVEKRKTSEKPITRWILNLIE